MIAAPLRSLRTYSLLHYIYELASKPFDVINGSSNCLGKSFLRVVNNGSMGDVRILRGRVIAPDNDVSHLLECRVCFKCNLSNGSVLVESCES